MEANTKMNEDIKNIDTFFSILSTYAKSLDRPIVYCDAIGPYECTDPQKLEKVYSIFEKILPIEVYHTLKNNRRFSLIFDDYEKALDFCLDNFPKTQEECEPEFYIRVELFNNLGESMYENK